MEQSAPVSLEAVCSGIVLPVVTNVVVLVAVYAMPMGVAHAVSMLVRMMIASVFI